MEGLIEANRPEDLVLALLTESGLTADEIAKLPSSLIEGLRILDEATHVIDHQRRIIGLANRIFQELDRLGEGLDVETQRVVRIASAFCDVGKGGPPDASEAHRRAVAQYYAIDNIPPELFDKPVSEILRHPKISRDHLLKPLSELDASIVATTGKEFRKRHLEWTMAHFKGGAGSVLPDTVLQAMARHHHLDQYPPSVLEQPLTPADMLVIILDQYDALRCRGKKSHGEAISALDYKIRQIFGPEQMETIIAFEDLMDVLAVLENDNYCVE